MAQFDVYRLAEGTFVVECQADLLSSLHSRFVVPLLPPHLVDATKGLNPSFNIEGRSLHFVPQGAATILASELREKICSLEEQRFTILNAIDLLISGA